MNIFWSINRRQLITVLIGSPYISLSNKTIKIYVIFKKISRINPKLPLLIFGLEKSSLLLPFSLQFVGRFYIFLENSQFNQLLSSWVSTLRALSLDGNCRNSRRFFHHFSDLFGWIFDVKVRQTSTKAISGSLNLLKTIFLISIRHKQKITIVSTAWTFSVGIWLISILPFSVPFATITPKV